MDFAYQVHRVNRTSIETDVTINIGGGEQTVKAQVPAVEMELVSLEGQGTTVVRFVGEQATDAAKTFSQGQNVTVTVAAAAQ